MKKINTLQLCTSLLMVLSSSFLGIEFYNLIKYSQTNGIISIIVSLIICLLITYIFLTIFNYKKELNIKEKINDLFNKKISLFLITISSIILLIISIILNYDLNNFIISQFLSETPIYVVAALFSILFFYINKEGYETIIKVSTLLFFINTILFLIVPISKINGFDINNIKPITYEIKPIIKGSIYIISFFINFITLFLLLPKKRIANNTKLNKYIIITIIISFIYKLIITIITISTLSIYLAKIYQYPAYMILKNISLLNTFDRIENIIYIEWIFQIFITISLIINYISKTLKIKHYYINIIIFTSTILFFDNNTFFYNISVIIPYLSLIQLLILIIIFIKIKRKPKLSN